MQRLVFVVSLLLVALAQNASAAASPPPPADPLAAWLSSEGFVPGGLDRDVARGWVNVSLTKGPHHFEGERLALVRSFAQRAAAVEGLPPLDTVDLEPPVRRREGPLAKTFRRLTLRLAQPPTDGLCIDPRVEVGIYDDQVDNGYASPRATSLTVRCEREPTDGNKPAVDPGRILPRAAVGALPFVAQCAMTKDRAMVIDRRGDIYEYQPHDEPSTVQALAVDIRHRKHYAGSLTPAALDRLIALTSFVASARIDRKADPGEDCGLFRAGKSDALVRISLDRRLGAAAEEARHLVHRDN